MGTDTQNCSLDLGHLSLQTMGDRTLQNQVLAIFVRHMKEMMPRLENDEAEVSAVAHGIKGSARGIGAWQLANAAEAVEKATGDRIARVETLKATIETTLADIGRLLDAEA